MKKLLISAALSGFLFTASPLVTNAAPDPVKTETSIPPNEQAGKLINRLKEIDRMNKSHLSRSDKKELRKEVRTIHHELRQIGGGIYISAGALILILILLVILT